MSQASAARGGGPDPQAVSPSRRQRGESGALATNCQRKPSPPCALCADRVRFTLAMAATYRLPLGNRTVGPHETNAWARLQRQSVLELAAALAAAGHCDG